MATTNTPLMSVSSNVFSPYSTSLHKHLRTKEAIMLYVAATVIRVVLILYAEWQDANMLVKYTDIDYVVFSDAARFVTENKSPYLRSTYRYTPLLAWILTPNIWLHKTFGKFLFALTDIIIGMLLHGILLFTTSSSAFRSSPLCATPSPKYSASSPLLHNNNNSPQSNGNTVLFYVATWLLNPIVINVSTRGNAESLVSILVLASLYAIFNKRIIIGSIIFGLAVHFKIYPIIYAFPLYFFIGREDINGKSEKNKRSLLASLLHPQRLKFFVISASTFLIVTGYMYYLYGEEFLEETYLYHVRRKDIRHSFSVYFYYLYLTNIPSVLGTSTMSIINNLAGVLSFIPQLLICIGLFTWRYYNDITFCLFIQTFAFVTFNKVCTVQYFVWYYCFLPLVLPLSTLKLFWKGATLLAAWFASQGLWLLFAYRLEFLGENTFFLIWVAGIIFFFVNIWILVTFITHHRSLKISKTE